MMSVHPTTKQIEFLARDQLDQTQADQLRAHLEECPDCQQKHAEYRDNQSWEQELRAAALGDETLRCPGFDQADHQASLMTAGTEAIEGYTLGHEIGEGGQGVVFQAYQHFPKREVAIKFLREGRLATAAAKKRFEREITIAASLKHSNIVTIFDTGVLPEGRRFCVMEYVHGLPITEYIRHHKLNLKQSLELFAQVCEAVNYAHQRGIMHRDLKPSNILVDADGRPKVMDFGLARMVSEPSRTVSHTGQVVGAPAYLSPEQTRGNPDEIDIRTDVYSLGIILYELLTGGYPYDVECAWGDLITHIRESPPTPPSSVWKFDSGVRPEGKSTRIGTALRKHCPIDKEVETIVLVCLRKERDRRYQSAGELARDIRHYLAGEPIEASRDSITYVLKKWLHRHRRAFALGLAIFILLIAGLSVIAIQSIQAEKQREKLQRAAAREIMAAFVYDPVTAIKHTQQADQKVKANLAALNLVQLASSAYTDRIQAARSGLILNPEAFWQSIDGKELWKNGEWLEICRVDWPDRAAILKLLAEKALQGTDRQQYVAFCLVGQLADKNNTELADLCVKAMNSNSRPGVLAAARWAAQRMGGKVDWSPSDGLFSDELSGLTFVKIPGCSSFRRGSATTDPDRYPNEDPPNGTVTIKSFYVATTETTVAAFKRFYEDPANKELFDSTANKDASKAADLWLLARTMNKSPETALGGISLDMAKRYCAWLNKQNGQLMPPHRYRLPTEDEWEYACGAENEGRFCFGSQADYLTYFANCNGRRQTHTVGQQMPNWFGVSDMHGGLWEWCDSPFPVELTGDLSLANEKLFVKRGGAFYSPAVRCRSAQRNYATANAVDHYTGFRLVMEVGEP